MWLKLSRWTTQLDEKVSVKEIKVVYDLQRVEIQRGAQRVHGIFLFQEITSTGIKKGELFIADVNTQLKNKNITTNVKVDTNSRLSANVSIDDHAPGLKAIFNFFVTDQRYGKVIGFHLSYQHEYNSISTSIGLTANPVVNFSGVVKTPLLSLGTDLSCDTASVNLTKCNAGVSFTNVDLIAAVTLVDVCVFFNASYCHIDNPLTNTVVGAELAYSFSTNENTSTTGTQKSLFPLTSIKARINNHGKASALIQHEWKPKSLFSVLINQLTV
ncbi:mitochondrial outer membrane protein porin of 36 kDa-like [Papaver somniferum]|uniref:mitochondrial outer membrane protein porin of 36 kDa-like n=1 Tax=Papaver somniferum TaxID=3469 RepID=UPI000E6F47B9|nr:mitochondrial outer membrane protein porin of 36 kDa-like [Papaver somniferum]